MIRKTWSVTKKELLHITRSAGTLFLVTASPVVMLVLMAGLLIYNPRKKRAVGEPEGDKEKDAAHGTVVRH